MDGPEGPGSRWVVENNTTKVSHILDRIEKAFVDTVTVKDTRLELYTIKIKDTEDIVPIALCLPTQTPAPGIILYSGHTAEGGLRDLFVDDDSYQKAMARRLCEAGFATLAVEKIDSGLMTMHFQRRGERFTVEREPGGGADDELEAATTLLGVGDYLIPGRQLMANIAALEILSADPRVDHTRIGAAGVSAGGWMALHSALVNARIKAVANYGGMWSYLEATMEKPDYKDFQGITDFTQLIPGIWKLGDQNRFVLAVPPLVMQIGYGQLDHPYTTYKKYFFPVVGQQYEMLGARGNLEIVTHKKGHEFPPAPIISFFKRRLNK
ncbi:MAG: acetylxylan esterase [Gammaproteobacteria bacterium]|nr:acetylxylan esterase [Gammaproteobacteria bacterium]